MDYLTRRARRVLSELAPREAQRLGHKQVREEHVLLGMVAKQNRDFLNELVVASIFSQYRVDFARLTREIGKHAVDLSESEQNHSRTLRYLEEDSLYEAQQMKNCCVGTEHILLALLRAKSSTVAACVKPYGLTHKALQVDLARGPRI